MKRNYCKPVMLCETFIPNEYVSACGDSGKVYKFQCDAGSEYSSYNVYLANGTPLGGYRPCNKTHEADSDSGFEPGYMYQDFMGFDVGSKIDVYIWTDNGTNVHCTTNLDMEQWETAKS